MDIRAALQQAIVHGCVVGVVITTVWGAVRLRYQRVHGRAMPRTPAVLFLDGLVDALPNLMGTANKWLPLLGGPVLFFPPFIPPTAIPQTAPPPPPVVLAGESTGKDGTTV